MTLLLLFLLLPVLSTVIVVVDVAVITVAKMLNGKHSPAKCSRTYNQTASSLKL